MKDEFRKPTEGEAKAAFEKGQSKERDAAGFERGSIEWAVVNAFSKAYEVDTTKLERARQRQMSKTAHLTGLEAVFYEIDELTSKLTELKEKIKQARCKDDSLYRYVASDIHEAGAIALDAITSNLQLWQIFRDGKT
jgi:hypothetical protein